MLDVLRSDSMVGLVCLPDEPGVPHATPAKRVERIDFAPLDPSAEALMRLRGSLPSSLEVASLTRALFERCQWREMVESAAGGVDAFLESGSGLCLVAGDEILCEAYAPFVGRRTAEVGVITSESQRGRGLAAIAIAFLAEDLARRGLALYWSCDADNTASIRTAVKLGFESPRSYAMLLYRPSPGSRDE